MPLDEVEVLLKSPVHEARVGAVSIMDFQARNKRTPPKHRKELFDPTHVATTGSPGTWWIERAVRGRRLPVRQAPRHPVPACKIQAHV